MEKTYEPGMLQTIVTMCGVVYPRQLWRMRLPGRELSQRHRYGNNYLFKELGLPGYGTSLAEVPYHILEGFQMVCSALLLPGWWKHNKCPIHWPTGPYSNRSGFSPHNQIRQNVLARDLLWLAALSMRDRDPRLSECRVTYPEAVKLVKIMKEVQNKDPEPVSDDQLIQDLAFDVQPYEPEWHKVQLHQNTGNTLHTYITPIIQGKGRECLHQVTELGEEFLKLGLDIGEGGVFFSVQNGSSVNKVILFDDVDGQPDDTSIIRTSYKVIVTKDCRIINLGLVNSTATGQNVLIAITYSPDEPLKVVTNKQDMKTPPTALVGRSTYLLTKVMLHKMQQIDTILKNITGDTSSLSNEWESFQEGK